MSRAGLRLIVYDATDRGVGRLRPSADSDGRSRESVGLAPVWWLGAAVHRGLGRVDGVLGAQSWEQALDWAAVTADQAGRPIAELQAWGHGGWGSMRIGRSQLDERALDLRAPLANAVDDLVGRLTGNDALLWLRCCSAFGREGRAFALALGRRLGCRVAGHTHVIGFFQSGLHTLVPGAMPDWDADEGVRRRADRLTADRSSPFAPRTITALQLDLPRGL